MAENPIGDMATKARGSFLGADGSRAIRVLGWIAVAASLTAPEAARRAVAAAAADDSLVTAAMTARYPAGYVQFQHCWIYTDKRYGRYCVRPIRSEWVERSDARQLYVLVSGIPINRDDAIDVLPAHALPGLVGAFALAAAADGAPKFFAATDAFMYGSFGDSGASVARLTRIGDPDYYAWIFSSGGTWQGVSVGQYHILAPHEDRFVDLSTVPTLRETEQQYRYTIEYDPASCAGPVYPLTVLQLDNPDGGRRARFLVPFNFRTWRYEMPWSAVDAR